MSLPGALTLTTLSGTYTAPDGTPLGGQLTFTPSSALTNEFGHPVLAATPLTVRLAPGTGSFSISLLNTDNAGLLPDTWMWHVIVAVAGAQETYFFGLPSTLGPTTDINALTPVSPPPAGVTFVASINGQTGDVVLADGFGILPPAGDLGGSTLAPQVTATHLSAPLPVVQGGTGAASGSAALTALGAASASALTAEVSRAEAAEAGFASSSALTTETSRAETAEALLAPKASPALTGTPTAPTASALTSTTQLATTAYADSAVSAETSRATTAEALKQGVRSPTVVKTGTSYTAVAGDYAKIDSTAGAYTVTVPTAPADKTVLGVKLVASATPVNQVTVTCGGTDKFNLPGGGTTLTLKLLNQGCQIQYNSGAGVWDVHGDDLPLGGLDARYANVFSPMAYGAAGNGTTDDTTAVQSAFAAASAAGGIVSLGTSTFLTSSPVVLHSNTLVRGSAILGGGTIQNSTSDLFTASGTVSHVTFENCTLVSLAGGGHIWNASDGTLSASFWTITGVQGLQNNAGKAIWYQLGGASLDFLVGDNSFFLAANGATVSPFTFNGGPFTNLQTNLDLTSLMFRRMRVQFGGFPAGGGAAPFFSFDRQNINGWSDQVVFDHITFEVCTNGCIYATAASDWEIRNCAQWDNPTATGNMLSFGTSSAGYHSSNIRVVGGKPAPNIGSFSHFFADSTSLYILIDSFSDAGASVISSPPAATTYINCIPAAGNGPSALQAPLFISAGITGATAASRYAGATASGHPVSGTFAVGDWVVDQTGSIWVCTTAGTPGTWVQLAAGSSFATASDPNSLGFTSTYMHGSAGATAAFNNVSSTQFGRLLAGGYPIAFWTINVGTSSGNISVGAYATSGSGPAATPTGGLLHSSGALACPASGVAKIAIGATITPNLTDWAAISCDNSTATFTTLNAFSATSLMSGLGAYGQSHSDTGCTTQSGGSANVVLDAAASTSFVGYGISNTNIPANTTITAASAGTSYTISANATGAASGLTCVIGPHPLVATPTVNVNSTGVVFMKGTLT